MQRRDAMRAMLGAALSALPIAALTNQPTASVTPLPGTGRFFGLSDIPVTDLGTMKTSGVYVSHEIPDDWTYARWGR